MSENIKFGVPSGARPSKPPASGIQPGSLHGTTLQYSGPAPLDPDDELIARVKNMSGSEMRHWLKQGTNRQDYDRALASKGK